MNKITYLSIATTSLFLFSGCRWFSCCCDKQQPQQQAQAESAPTALKITTQADFESNVIKATKPVVVYLGAPWCGACQATKPYVYDVAKEMSNQYTFVEIDVDQVQAIADQYGIRGIPTIMFFKDGKEIDESKRIIGSTTKEKLKEAVTTIFGK